MSNKAETIFFMVQGIVCTLGAAWVASGTLLTVGLLSLGFSTLFAFVL